MYYDNLSSATRQFAANCANLFVLMSKQDSIFVCYVVMPSPLLVQETGGR